MSANLSKSKNVNGANYGSANGANSADNKKISETKKEQDKEQSPPKFDKEMIPIYEFVDAFYVDCFMYVKSGTQLFAEDPVRWGAFDKMKDRATKKLIYQLAENPEKLLDNVIQGAANRPDGQLISKFILSFVDMIFKYLSDPNFIKEGDTSTPLMICAFKNNMKMVRKLLQHGAKASLMVRYDGDSIRATDLAEDPALVRLLLAYSEIEKIEALFAECEKYKKENGIKKKPQGLIVMICELIPALLRDISHVDPQDRVNLVLRFHDLMQKGLKTLISEEKIYREVILKMAEWAKQLEHRLEHSIKNLEEKKALSLLMEFPCPGQSADEETDQKQDFENKQKLDDTHKLEDKQKKDKNNSPNGTRRYSDNDSRWELQSMETDQATERFILQRYAVDRLNQRIQLVQAKLKVMKAIISDCHHILGNSASASLLSLYDASRNNTQGNAQSSLTSNAQAHAQTNGDSETTTTLINRARDFVPPLANIVTKRK